MCLAIRSQVDFQTIIEKSHVAHLRLAALDCAQRAIRIMLESLDDALLQLFTILCCCTHDHPLLFVGIIHNICSK
ncbi:hypothetical protein D1872_295540 [compost metagenome]